MKLQWWLTSILLMALLLAPVLTARAQDGEPPAAGEGDAGADAAGEEPPAEKTVVPAWQVGDWWKVEFMPLVGTMPKRPTTGPGLARDPRVKDSCMFTVEEMQEVDGNSCYVIKVVAEGEPNHYHRYFIRSANLTVKRFEEIQLVDGQESINATQNPVKAFFRLDSGTTIPFDVARFPIEEQDETTGDTAGNTSIPFVQKATYAPDKKTVTFELTAKVNGKDVKSYQKWEAGKPWWAEAKRTEGGADAEMGKLVDYSGKE